MKLKLDLSKDIRDRSLGTLFWACYLAFATTSFVFMVRTQIINGVGVEFGLSETQKGEILGAGIWPWAISIVLFSMVMDRLGYGKTIAVGFCCHMASNVIMLMAQGYWWLYIGSFLFAFGNGAVQAVCDAAVASMFKENKSKWLNIFHTAWPIGMIVGGPFGVLIASRGLGWRWQVGLMFVPVVIYGIVMLGKKFPVHERVAAGVSYRDMLRESGALSMMIVLLLICGEMCRVFQLPPYAALVIASVIGLSYWLYVRAAGQLVFIILLLLMLPLAATEISTNSWITALMEHELGSVGVDSSWVLISISVIMVILRFCAGPIIRLLSPLGLLAVSCLFAAAGLVAYSQVTGWAIFIAAIVFAVGVTFLWPTMLGVTAERFPKGGAVSLNMVTAVGVLSAGILGSSMLGFLQDAGVEKSLLKQDPTLHAQVVVEKKSLIGKYRAVDPDRLGNIGEQRQTLLDEIRYAARKQALLIEALLPLVTFVSFVLLILYFKRKGGYRIVSLQKE